MANPSKIRGTRWESEVVAYLKANGYPTAERRALAGALDLGDIINVPGTMIECKNTKAFTPGEFMKEVETQKKNSDSALGMAFVKRRNHSVADSFALLSIEEVVWMLRKIHGRS